MCGLDNHFALQLSKGLLVWSRNPFSRSDTIILLDRAVCIPKESTGYLNRLVLVLGITLGIRPTAMHDLTLDQFNYTRSKMEQTIMFIEKFGLKFCGSKTKQDRKKFISLLPVTNTL